MSSSPRALLTPRGAASTEGDDEAAEAGVVDEEASALAAEGLPTLARESVQAPGVVEAGASSGSTSSAPSSSFASASSSPAFQSSIRWNVGESSSSSAVVSF